MELLEPGQNPESRSSDASILSLFQLRNFRLLWLGETISVLGDQFYLIALPWLVLRITGNGLAMGTVLALAAIPRALFMLVGGALTDRLSPRFVMLVSNIARMVLVFLLALLVLLGAIEMWMIYILALLFGLADAFFYPAQSAIVPRLVESNQLQPANALMQGTWQLSLFAGPVLAGFLISALASDPPAGAGDMRGIGLAFVIDALTFLASAVTLLFIDDGQREKQKQDAGESLLQAIAEGLKTVWQDAALRAFFLLIAISNFLIVGPLAIGVPILTVARFDGGADAYGAIMSAYGGGMLLGTILAGLLPRPPSKHMGIFIGLIWSGLGLGVLAMGLVSVIPTAAAIAAFMGLAEGYVTILFITWLQRRTSDAMLGRMMSLLMFASVGLQPVSNVVTGALIDINAQMLFISFGALMIVVTWLFLINPAVRSMELPGEQDMAPKNMIV